MVCCQDGPMFGLLLSSVFSGHIPPGHRLPTGSSALVGQEVTSHALVGMLISMVRGRDGSPSLRPAPRRVDNLRTEWLSIYLFLVVGLPCSGAGKSLKDVGTLEPPDGPDPTLLPDQPGLQLPPGGARPRAGATGTGSVQGCRFKRKAGDAAREKKNPPPKVYEKTSTETSTKLHINIKQTQHPASL